VDLVEKVARAICKSRSCEGFKCCEWPANRGRMTCPVELGGYDDAASAAIGVCALAANGQEERGK
jgi:hypothetical protein